MTLCDIQEEQLLFQNDGELAGSAELVLKEMTCCQQVKVV